MRQDPPQGLHTAHAGHRQIHDNDVRAQIRIALAGRLAGLGLGHHGHISLRLQQQAESHANHCVVVDQQHADHALPFARRYQTMAVLSDVG